MTWWQLAAPALVVIASTVVLTVWVTRAAARSGCRCGEFPISERATVRFHGILHTRSLCQPDREVRRFFKATRMDGSDFYTGMVDYAAALETGEELPTLLGGTFPGEGWYHVGVHPTSCVGFRWPCRLFLVEPVGPVEHVGSDKAGCRSLRVVEERPAFEVFGPQGEHVAALIEQFSRLERAQLDTLCKAARDAARDAAWDAAWPAAWDAARVAARDAAWDAAWDAARVAARPAAWALIVRDLIDRDTYDTLTTPWRTAVGPIHPEDREVIT